MSIQLFAAISRKSITNDEVVHIPAGYYHLVAGDFQLNNEHPPLVKMWAALSLLFVQPNEPNIAADSEANFSARTWGFHQEFWFANRARFQAVSYWPRVMMVPITLMLGLIIFLFTRRLFGATAALIAVALFTLEPNLLAHGRIVHTDVPSTLAFLLFFYALFNYSHQSSWRNAILLALATSVALLTKFSMVILVPVLCCYAIGRFWMLRSNRAERTTLIKQALATIFIIILAINMAYYFQRPPLSSSDQKWLRSNSPSAAETIDKGIRAASYVVPPYFLFGIYNVVVHNRGGHAASLLGTYGNNGWWYYFPVAFALKTTLPFLMLSVAAVLWALWSLFARSDRRFLWLLIPLAIYTLVSLTGHINIGIRHFLPAFPFLIILGAAFLSRFIQERSRVVGVALVTIIFGWMLVEVVRTFPNYTPYMNQLASAKPHWMYLSDSNVEWGDDVLSLVNYLKVRGETSVRGALSGGWSTLPEYGIDYISLAPPASPTKDTKYVAIGASFLNGSTVPNFERNGRVLTDEERVNLFDSYRHRVPEAIFGGSIYLYREH